MPANSEKRPLNRRPAPDHSSDVYLPDVGSAEAEILWMIRERRKGLAEEGYCLPADVGLAKNMPRFRVLVNKLLDLGWPLEFEGSGKTERVQIQDFSDDKEAQQFIFDLFGSYEVGYSYQDWHEAEAECIKNGGAPDWQLQPVAALLETPAPTRWLVRDVLSCNDNACLFGASGDGKSFIAVDLACCIATGSDWHGHKTARGKVVYLVGEGYEGIRRRFLAWSIAHGIDYAKIPVVLSSAAIGLQGNKQRVAAAIFEACEGVSPALIVVDTMSRHLPPGANENSGADVGPFLDALEAIGRQFGATTLLIHHTGHTATARERGWSGIRAPMDWSYSVQKGDQGPIILQCRKAKDHKPPEPMRFALQSVDLPWRGADGEQDSSAVPVLAEAAPVVAGKNQTQAMDALSRLLDKTADEQVPVNSWRKESGLDRKRWPETFKALVSSGVVIVEGELVRLASEPS